MHGDISRWTFDPASGDRGVVTFQGRIVLDQDLNKQWQIADHLRAHHTADIVGPCGAPEADAGFAITVSSGELQAGAGSFYNHGTLCLNPAPVPLAAQPYLPADAPLVRLADGSDVTLAAAPNGIYFAVLDCWTRLVTPLQQPSLLDPALGGADTAGVARTIWQVRLVEAAGPGGDVDCLSEPPAWQALVAGPSGTFRARAQPSTTPSGPCVVEAGAGYRRVSNQLYRVEVHRGGAVGTASFKWSRENGSVATGWLGSSGSNLTVASIGRDRARGFAPGDWVELTDDEHALTGAPGTMVRLLTARDNVLVIDPATADGPTGIGSFGTAPIIRRWDGDGVRTITVPGGNDGYLALEDGVEIGFEAGAVYRSGDYVTIPARYEINDVEWPDDPATGLPARLPAQGIHHGYCKLALVEKSPAWTILSDCRPIFPALTGLVTIAHIGGDGQEAAPDPGNPATLLPLGAPLQVGVSRGSTPLEGQRVRFTVTAGSGLLTGNLPVVEVATDAAGIASVAWSVDGATPDQRVEAELLDPADNRRHLPIAFNASLSRAEEVSYDPVNCPPLAGAITVQQAIDRLCQLGNGGGCATYVVTPGTDWVGLLTGLQPNEHAHICFQRGRYEATGPVTMTGLGHIHVSGCGEATEIVVRRAERALEAVDCASFTLSEISVATPDGGTAVGEVQHLNGTITTTGCPEVTITGCAISCGAGTGRDRACVTIRPRGFDAAGRPTPLRSIRVTGNRLTAGYGQIGLLITDAAKVRIRDNDLNVAARPAGLTIDRLLANPVRVAALARQLVGRAVLEGASPVGGARVLRAGGFTAYLQSSVPQSEWQALLEASPPPAAALRSEDRFRAYVEGLVRDATADPARLPSYRRQVGDLRAAIGEDRFATLDTQVFSSLLLRGAVAVESFGAGPSQRQIAFVLDNRRVAFDSAVSQGDWQNIARAAPPGPLRSDGDLLAYAKGMARRLVTDAEFRVRFPSAQGWFTALAANVQPAGHQGIVIGGRSLGSGEISGNRIEGFAFGLHIGLSHSDPTRVDFDTARSVTVQDNEIFLRRPFEAPAGSYGVFVGNAARVRIEGNEVRWSRTDARWSYREAFRIWGRMGELVVFRENLVDLATCGLRMRHTGPGVSGGAVQWLAADNWIRGVQTPNGTNILDVPGAMVRRNNKRA